MDDHNQQSMEDFLRDMFPDFQEANLFPAENLELPDVSSLGEAWLRGTAGTADLPASEAVSEAPQNNDSDGQLQSDYLSSLSQVNDNAGLHAPPWFVLESTIIEQRIEELHEHFRKLQENICKIMTYQKQLLPWTVAMNESQSNLAQQVVQIWHKLSNITTDKDEPKGEQPTMAAVRHSG